MYFTENRYDRSIEWMMKGVPNFYARSSGIVVTGKFEYTAEMCDCRLCEHYGGKLRGCKVPRCVCLEERIAVGAASLKEVMKETMSEIKHGYCDFIEDNPDAESITADVEHYLYGEGESENADEDDIAEFEKRGEDFLNSDEVDYLDNNRFIIPTGDEVFYIEEMT